MRTPLQITNSYLHFGKLQSSFKISASAHSIYRDFVASNWPNKNTAGGNIKDMYERLVNPGSEPPKKEANGNTGAPTVNGQVNGVDVKQE